MPTPISRDSPIAKAIAEISMVPVERIQHWAVIVQYDTCAQLIHTLCCDKHAREQLALMMATAPDIPDLYTDQGEN
jgi:hypothetical protein